MFLNIFLLVTSEKVMARHSSALAWRIPGTGEPGGLPSMGSHRVRHDWGDLAAAAAAGGTQQSTVKTAHALQAQVWGVPHKCEVHSTGTYSKEESTQSWWLQP